MNTEQLVNPDALALNPSDLQTQQASSSAPAPVTGRNEDFDAIVASFGARENQYLMDNNLSTTEYLIKSAENEQLELEELEKWKGKEGLSESQRREMDARLQYLGHSKETRELQAEFDANPDDPEIKARYDQRQQELTEYRQLLQESPEFRDNEHLQRVKELEKDLAQAETLEEKNAIKMEMAGEMRGFRQDLLQDPEGAEKIISFVERNRDNTIVKNSGMIEGVEALKSRRAEMGIGNDELENATVTPNREATAGAVEAADRNSEAAKTAEGEVVATVDKGEGAIKPVRLEGGVDTSDTIAQKHLPNERPQEKDAALTV